MKAFFLVIFFILVSNLSQTTPFKWFEKVSSSRVFNIFCLNFYLLFHFRKRMLMKAHCQEVKILDKEIIFFNLNIITLFEDVFGSFARGKVT